MRLDNQYASDDCDEHCANCGDNSNHQPSIFSDNRASLIHRNYAKLLASIGGLTAVAGLVTPLVGLTHVFECSYTGPVHSDGICLVDGNGERIGKNALGEGEKMAVFPEPWLGIEKTPTLFVRHAEDIHGGTTNLEYTVSGYAAYSKVCIHVGCVVSNEDGAALVRPCHFGKFSPTADVKVVGGSPSRALPQLPITLPSEGNLIAMGDFNGPVGPGGE